jgi:hypothetical protein
MHQTNIVFVKKVTTKMLMATVKNVIILVNLV